ncbi:MAG TPA: glycosyltransferase [Patescibacteria group bacterium]|nr:glycosyltransferase [Patescibacteria group bacterium]
MTKIWAHTLVKNESRWLWYAVSSIIEHVDRLLLWDTGSTDNSIEIEKALIKKYPEKIEFKQRKIFGTADFTNARQEMLDATNSDWFLMLDGDEIWWEDSIKKVVKAIDAVEAINNDGKNIESIVVPTVNLVGDIFHYQEKSAGRYKFGDRTGHYNLRAINRSISGLKSLGVHGLWGWADGENKMIQDRNSYKFIDAPYLHATNLKRSVLDNDVIKRKKKHRFEIGEEFPKDFYYPEVLFRGRSYLIESPWQIMENNFKFRAFFETPARKLKRKVFKGGVGY